MRDATAAGPARPDASHTRGTEAEDAITVAPEGEENGVGTLRRIRKPSAKARENGIVQDPLDAALLLGKQNGSAARGATANDMQTKILNTILEAWTRQEKHYKALQVELGRIKDELQAVKEECKAAREECQAAKEESQEIKNELYRIQQQVGDGIATLASGQGSPRPSYADIVRTPPTSQPSGVRTLSSANTTPSTFTDTLFCTVDTSRVEEGEKNKVQVADIRKAIEKEIRTQEDMGRWRCTAVVKEARNPDRIRVVCRDEGEVQLVKEAAQKITVPGVRVLRDQLYPVKVDNANRTAVLDADGNILPGVAEALGTENEVNIAKIAWLSRKDMGKAYGSMVVYVTKSSEAKRLLEGQYFHLAGESAYTTMFAPREGPTQCFNCQEIGHKAYACKKPQVCGKCARQGHHHKTCQAAEPKCVLCSGPHESFNRNCRVRRLHKDA